MTTGLAVGVTLAALAGSGAGRAQTVAGGISIVPVSFEMAPGQMTAVLNIQNNTDREADFQVRPYVWSQPAGDQLSATDALMVSPPLGRIPAGAAQIVRLVLRSPAQTQEAAYRILLDQVPPPPQPGVVGFSLRFSVPIFADPPSRVSPRVRWSIQSEGGDYYLVAVNSGGRHDAFRDIALTSAKGGPIAIESGVSPYVLAGATRRWRILSKTFAPSPEALHLMARSESGEVDQPVSPPSVGP